MYFTGTTILQPNLYFITEENGAVTVSAMRVAAKPAAERTGGLKVTQLRIENHNSVTLLNRLRIATRSTTARERRGIFNGLRDALKGLGLVEAKGTVEGIYEGIDSAGNHWFMVDMGDRLPEAGDNPVLETPKLFAGNQRSDDLQRALGELSNVMDNPAVEWNRQTSSLEASVVRTAVARLKRREIFNGLKDALEDQRDVEKRRTPGSDGEQVVHPQAQGEQTKG